MSEQQRLVSVDRPRCPYCHEDLEQGQVKAGCSECMAWHHAECWQEHGACSACGATVEGSPRDAEPVDPVLGKVVTLLQAGDELAAVRHYAEHKQVDLKTAKDAVDALARGALAAAGGARPRGGPLDAQLEDELRAGRKLAAIARYRELHGGSLKDAKEAVEALQVELGVPHSTPDVALLMMLVGCLVAVLVAAAFFVLSAR
ncbi:MAG: hypothetical protein KDD82_26890 [Planctomycetes bacterium]|nr:hypothetical protein [Planctomycetota bacterium]